MGYRFRYEERERLEVVRCYIAAHLDEKLLQEALCRMALMNRHKLNAGFEQFYGKTVRLYIDELRMQKAKELLQSGDESIEAIAAATGYGYATSFCTRYKRYFGYAPREERRRQP